MTLYTDHSYSRVMVFIDYRNIYEGVRFGFEGMSLDLFRMTDILVGGRSLVGAYVFDGMPPSTGEGDDKPNETRKFHNSLRENGFRVIVRDAVVKQEGGKAVQKEVDVSLACEMLEHALMNHFDVAIVVSGDRDFVPAMQKVQSSGKRVEVASFSNELNPECRRTADVYYMLDEMPIMEMMSPVDEGGDARWSRSATCSICNATTASPRTSTTARCRRSASSDSSGTTTARTSSPR